MPISPGNGIAWRRATTERDDRGGLDLAPVRRRYAETVAAAVRVRDPRIIDAFASVPRERHLPPPPWSIIGGAFGRIETDDPADLYRDVLVALSPEAGINNGEPSLHASSIGEAAPRPGERVVHVGAGGGYYSAIFAELVGPSGRVTAFEVEPHLVALARAALATYPNVVVEARSGSLALPEADIVYVSAATPVPPEPWLDALADGGRLVFPMAPTWGNGSMLLVTRRGAGYAARFFAPCRFIPLSDAPEREASARLEAVFARRDWTKMRSLRRGAVPVGEQGVWFAWDKGWLSERPAGT